MPAFLWENLMRTILAFCILIIFCCGVLAQKPKPPSKDEINAFLQQDLEKKRQEAAEWKEKWATEYDSRKAADMQLMHLRAAVAKAAKL